ncbi:zeta toxin family protein [Phenylobacterium sp.]|jgi:predicted ABC-type ATPase|uniref:zeta toxin family protein n=1 Tax=Phenylobacterium sp. TaxID=1871053 RepID=UPI002E348DFF|nr:zeta toxin family protein [Phenylobacterium sp.]HEX4712053.1 zeta toxin family protein [Phenylobacterium sp.]
MTAARPPVLHILAGPNGAGKSSLYEAEVSHLAEAEFVNADRLALKALGHHALTQSEAELGQRLAVERRAQLLAAKQDIVTESTFSHPSKLELVRDAKAAGYRVAVYHVNVESADLAVNRVRARQAHGGHPVAEDRIRGRYDRNPALIREAVLLADWAFVFDNSAFGARPRRIIAFANGRVLRVVPPLPVWAQALYGPDLKPWPGTPP